MRALTNSLEGIIKSFRKFQPKQISNNMNNSLITARQDNVADHFEGIKGDERRLRIFSNNPK